MCCWWLIIQILQHSIISCHSLISQIVDGENWLSVLSSLIRSALTTSTLIGRFTICTLSLLWNRSTSIIVFPYSCLDVTRWNNESSNWFKNSICSVLCCCSIIVSYTFSIILISGNLACISVTHLDKLTIFTFTIVWRALEWNKYRIEIILRSINVGSNLFISRLRVPFISIYLSDILSLDEFSLIFLYLTIFKVSNFFVWSIDIITIFIVIFWVIQPRSISIGWTLFLWTSSKFSNITIINEFFTSICLNAPFRNQFWFKNFFTSGTITFSKHNIDWATSLFSW